MIALNQTKQPAVWCPGLSRHMDLTLGLRGYWPLWEGAGSRASSLADKATGTLANGAGWGAGPGGSVVAFDGTASPGHYIDVPSAFDGVSGNSLTVMVRLRIDSYDTYGCVLFGTDTGASAYWQISGDNKVVIQSVTISPIGTPISFADGLWHTVAFVSRGSAGVEAWWDGKLAASSATPGTSLAAGAKNFYIGDWIGSPGTNWQLDGAIAELAFFDRALEPARIAWLYRNPFALCRPARSEWSILLAEPVEGPYRVAVGNVWHGGAQAGGQHLAGTDAGMALVDGQQAGRIHG